MSFIEDATRRKCTSISTCSSDPLQYRHEVGTTSMCSGASSLYSDGGSDDSARARAPVTAGGGSGGSALTKDALDKVGDASQARASSCLSSLGSKVLRSKRIAVEPTDLEEPLNAETEIDVLVANISTRPFAFIESVIPRGHTIVGVHADDGSVVSTGANVCLSDGRYVGRVVTVLGQVTSCRYAIVASAGHFASLLMASREGPSPTEIPDEDDGVPVPEYLKSSLIAMGTPLHFDVSTAEVIYDPATNVSRDGGTDASFVDDAPLPATARPDFSDDEEERKWKTQRRVAIAEKRETKDADAAAELAEEEEELTSSESEASFNEHGEIIAYAQARPVVGRKRARPARKRPAAAEWGHAQILGQQAGLVAAPIVPPMVPRPAPPQVAPHSAPNVASLVYRAPK